MAIYEKHVLELLSVNCHMSYLPNECIATQIYLP